MDPRDTRDIKLAVEAADLADGVEDALVDPQEISRVAHEILSPEDAVEIDAELKNHKERMPKKKFHRLLRHSRKLFNCLVTGICKFIPKREE